MLLCVAAMGKQMMVAFEVDHQHLVVFVACYCYGDLNGRVFLPVMLAIVVDDHLVETKKNQLLFSLNMRFSNQPFYTLFYNIYYNPVIKLFPNKKKLFKMSSSRYFFSFEFSLKLAFVLYLFHKLSHLAK